MKNNVALEKSLEDDLLNLYGPVLSSKNLLQVLGYVSIGAFRQSLSRNTVPVPIFKIANRRGYFALSKDVAKYLAERRYLCHSQPEEEEDM